MASLFLVVCVVCVNLVTLTGRMVDALRQGGELDNLKYASQAVFGLYFTAAPCAADRVLDNSKFGFPMPYVGMYIAVATLVCFYCMFSDLCFGSKRGKTWIPCKCFSVNSLMLTLVSVATKLSVDLTSSMPRAMDQLSKLTSSVFLCIAMAFFMPSIPSSSTSESAANLASLSVLVITVIVNVSIQISTGAIFAFVIEHVIVLICMLLLLMLLMCSTLQINLNRASIDLDFTKAVDETDRVLLSTSDLEGMKEQMKKLYVYGITMNPQFLSCVNSNCSSVGLLSGVVVGVAIEAVLRLLTVKDDGDNIDQLVPLHYKGFLILKELASY